MQIEVKIVVRERQKKIEDNNERRTAKLSLGMLF